MNTRKYPRSERKQMKREQRSPEYRALQARAKAERAALQAKLAQREKPLRDALREAREAINGFVDASAKLRAELAHEATWPGEAYAKLRGIEIKIFNLLKDHAS